MSVKLHEMPQLADTDTDNYRYNLKARIAMLPAPERKKMQKDIRTEHNISETTWWRYINIKQGDESDIPASVLRDAANYFSCSIEDLFNNA